MSLKSWYPLIDGSLENKGLDTTPLTLHGTVPFTNGRVRTAPTFSANTSNYYTMSPITKTNDFSVCLWFKFDNLARIQYLFLQGDVDVTSSRLSVAFGSSTQELVFHFGNVTEWRLLKNQLEANKWYHLCVTIDDSGFCHTYFNGENIYDATIATTIEPIETLLFRFNSPYTMDGQLQDFRYYDHCLSPKEVKEIAKGLCLHLPLKGTNARPNLFTRTITMFDGVGANNTSYSTWTKTSEFDENAPCGVKGKKVKVVFKREEGKPSSGAGFFYFANSTGMPNLTLGATYCVTVWARCTVPNVLLMNNVVQSQKILKNSNLYLTSEWKRYYFIFNALTETYTTCFYMQNVPVGIEGVFEVCCPKLELLSPTPYIPNVEDSQYSDYILDYEPDCSGNEFDATKHGDLTTSDSNGRYNTAVAFNGTNTYLQGLAPTNSECKEFTIATWVKLNNINDTYGFYCSRTSIGTAGVLFAYDLQKAIRLTDGGVTTLFTDTAIEANKWYHVAVTRTGTEKKCYINGELKATVTTVGTLSNMSDNYTVGSIYGYNSYLSGSLSDFRLYTSVLSADDVKELYETSASIAHNSPSLTESAYYNYIEEQKHSTFDKSKFTIVGSPNITDDGIASGFSTANKISIPVTIDTSKNWITKGKFKTPESTSVNTYYMISALGTRYSFRIQNDKISTCADFPTTGAGAIYLLESYNANTWYDYEYGCSGTKFFARIKKSSSSTWDVQKESTLTEQDTDTYQVYIGEYASGYPYLNGYIDLSKYSITVDSKEVFNGNKTGIDTVKPEDYTVVGTPTISEDGIASGFATTSYLTIPKEIINSLIGHNWKIEYKIKKPTIEKTSVLRMLLGSAYETRESGSLALGRFNMNNNWFANIKLSDDTYTTNFYSIFNINTEDAEGYLAFDGTKYINAINDDGSWKTSTYETTLSFKEETSDVILGYNLEEGSIDLNAFKIYVDDELIYQPCLKVPYTLGLAGIKIVDNTYLSRVQDVYDQHYLERYYTIDETIQTVYEYPLFRDSMHTYEFDEGLQASITKTGIHNATTLTEATKTSIQQNNTDTVTLIEN